MENVEAEVRASLDRYLAGDVSLDAFHEWFLSATWEDVESDLVKEISHLLIEYSNADLYEPELRDGLSQLSSAVVVSGVSGLALGVGTRSGANTVSALGGTRVIASPGGALTRSDSEATSGSSLAPSGA